MKRDFAGSSHLPKVAKPVLKPRKMPAQARSNATVDAILDATIQVLLAVGKERLTTSQVAFRAGVSVGTLYQYFPNKSSLLQACLRQHVDGVSAAVVHMCQQHRGAPLQQMGTALVDAYLQAKMKDVKASVTLYAVSSDVEGEAISRAAGARALHAAVDLFASTKDRLTKDPEVVATIVLSVINGVARRLLEVRSPERQLPLMRDEAIAVVSAYLTTCALRGQ